MKIYLFSVLILLFTPNVIASAETDFNRGVEFFNSGDYSSAITQFESAKKQGIHSISLFYNLASSYYKLGDYGMAKKYFKLVSWTPEMRDLAYYNLGLIALKENDRSQARQYFGSIMKTGKNKKLIKLAQKQLSEPVKSGSSFNIYLSSNMGYSDNIGSSPDDSVSDISDSFYDLFISARSLISGEEKAGWKVDAYFFSQDYTDTDTYDEYRYALGLKRQQKLFNWDTTLAINLAKNNISGDDYQSTAKMEVKALKALSENAMFYLRYSYEDVSSEETIYDYLEGWRQRARMKYRHYSGNSIKEIYYELELNDRNEIVAADNSYTYDYSPTRHTIRGQYTYLFSKKWRMSGDLSYRFSDYPESDTIDRDDDRLRIALSTDYRFDKTFKLVTKLQLTDNASTADQYSYDKTVFKLGLTKSF